MMQTLICFKLLFIATYHHKMLSKSDLVGIMPSQAPAADAEGSAGNPLDDKEEEGEDDDNDEPAGKKHGNYE